MLGLPGAHFNCDPDPRAGGQVESTRHNPGMTPFPALGTDCFTYRSVAQIPHTAMHQRRLANGCRDLAPRGVVKVRLGIRRFPVMWRHFADDHAAFCRKKKEEHKTKHNNSRSTSSRLQVMTLALLSRQSMCACVCVARVNAPCHCILIPNSPNNSSSHSCISHSAFIGAPVTGSEDIFQIDR